MRLQRLLQTITLLMSIAILTAACGSSDDDNAASADGTIEGELLDFALVQENDFTFESDPSDPNRGIFHVRTTQSMICTIVWGETEELGNFNNSLPMNGTGIIPHDAGRVGCQAVHGGIQPSTQR